MINKITYTNLSQQHIALKDKLLSAIEKVLVRGQFILGPEVEEFEARFARICKAKYAVGVGNGTDAIILALKAAGIQPGDEVITVANTFVSTVSSIIAVGAKPVFVDVQNDYNIDPRLIEKAITKYTKALLPVHLTGRPADMDPLMIIARKHGLKVVEDCAQAVGAEYKGQKVGTFGNIGCFSLHPLKILNACGDGGVIVTNDERAYEECRILRDNGMKNRGECVTWSSNSRLDSIQAAILLVKLDYLEEWTEKRIENAKYYQHEFSKFDFIRVPVDQAHERAVYQSFVIQAGQRDALKDYLAEKGVGTKIHYPIPVHLQPVARTLGYKRGDLPVTEEQSQHILSLPVYPELTRENLEFIVRLVEEFYQLEKVIS
jgi:dTDP-4-amino-4,6-dideoxygalactose transaminase